MLSASWYNSVSPGSKAQELRALVSKVAGGRGPGLGRSAREGIGYPLQYSGLENFMDREVWQARVHEIAKSNMTEQLSLSCEL